MTTDKKPGDAFYAFADALPSPPTMLLVTPAARQPCAGWVDGMARPGGWIMTPTRAEKLLIGDLWALVYTFDGDRHWWSTCFSDPSSARYIDGEFAAAQLAAEDALLAVRDAITRAVGR